MTNCEWCWWKSSWSIVRNTRLCRGGGEWRLQKISDLLASRQRIEPEATVLSCIFRYRTVPFTTIIFDIFTLNSGKLSCRRMYCGTYVILPWLEFGQHFFGKCKYISSSVHLVSFQVAHLASAHTMKTADSGSYSCIFGKHVGCWLFYVLYPLVLFHLKLSWWCGWFSLTTVYFFKLLEFRRMLPCAKTVPRIYVARTLKEWLWVISQLKAFINRTMTWLHRSD
jgi:hypothetical protein